MDKRKVVVIDDSPIVRGVLCDVLEADEDIEVVCEGEDGDEAVGLVRDFQPDLVTMDIQMERMDGLQAIEQLMAQTPVPILVVTSQPVGPDSTLAWLCVSAGALDVAEKPEEWGEVSGARIRSKVRLLSTPDMVEHVRKQRAQTEAAGEPGEAPEVGGTSGHIMAIGTSAGGPGVVGSLLGALPRGFPGCIALVQHLPPGFTPSFADYLRNKTSLDVRIVEEATAPTPETVLIPPDDTHLVVNEQRKFVPDTGDPVGGQRPSIDLLFQSVARTFGAEAVGIVLSGVGDDGAQGLLELHRTGALTIAQDEQSAAAFGLPRAAVDAGAAAQVVPPEHIAPMLLALTGASDLASSEPA